jgi:uncharacterized protein YggU (UPF0235/DUF167 family)
LYGVSHGPRDRFIVASVTQRPGEESSEKFRVAVRVKPGASRTRVGGRYGDSSLVVAVTAKAVDGQATEAVLRAVADAFGVPRRTVSLITGATARDKVVGVETAGEGARSFASLAQRATDLLVTPNE